MVRKSCKEREKKLFLNFNKYFGLKLLQRLVIVIYICSGDNATLRLRIGVTCMKNTVYKIVCLLYF